MAEADPPKIHNVHSAKTQRPRLIDRAHAGEEIIIAKAGKPHAKPVIEVAIKARRGKAPELRDPLYQFDEAVPESGFTCLPVTHVHARGAGLMPGDRASPLDRPLAAQGILENLAGITRDPQIPAFGAGTLW